jgi:hypothetical protein
MFPAATIPGNDSADRVAIKRATVENIQTLNIVKSFLGSDSINIR